MRIVPVYSRQILADSPPTKQGASDPISGLTGLCVYLLISTLIYFLPNQHHFPKKQPECPSSETCDRYSGPYMMFTLRWLLFLQFRVKI